MSGLTAVQKALLRNPEEVRNAMLTDNAIELYVFVKAHKTKGVSTSDCVKEFGVSIQAAGASLMQLVNRGYVKRIQQTAPSGGLFYKYIAK